MVASSRWAVERSKQILGVSGPSGHHPAATASGAAGHDKAVGITERDKAADPTACRIVLRDKTVFMNEISSRSADAVLSFGQTILQQILRPSRPALPNVAE
jgi:hypothetical protein